MSAMAAAKMRPGEGGWRAQGCSRAPLFAPRGVSGGRGALCLGSANPLPSGHA